MKILIIYPNKVMVTRMPLGISYLVACLKKYNHQIKVFDTTFFKCSDIQNDDKLREASLQVKNPDLTEYGIVNENVDVFSIFKKEIQDFNPDLIGASISDPNYKFGLEFLRLVKKDYSHIPTIIGGPTATVAPDEVIQEDCVDMLCRGEGEETFCELCNKMSNKEDIRGIKNLWVKEKGTIYKNPMRNLQDINTTLSPDLSILDPRHFMRPLGGKIYRMGTVMWTRGCAFHCAYCANSTYINLYQDPFYRIKDPNIFIKELEEIKNKFKLNFLFFVDDIFPLHKKDTLDVFCSLYKKMLIFLFLLICILL